MFQLGRSGVLCCLIVSLVSGHGVLRQHINAAQLMRHQSSSKASFVFDQRCGDLGKLIYLGTIKRPDSHHAIVQDSIVNAFVERLLDVMRKVRQLFIELTAICSRCGIDGDALARSTPISVHRKFGIGM
jgi:hypothetical protein